MRTVTSFIFLVLLVVLNGKAFAYGPPNYLPDGSHPRIWLTSSVLSTLQAKVAANDSDWLELKTAADTYLTYTIPAYDPSATLSKSISYAYQGLPWLDAAQTLGLAYKLTGNTSYAAKLKILIDVINAAGVPPIIKDSGYPSRSVAVAAALIYDWLYDYLDGPTKAATVATINSYYASFTTDPVWYSVSGPAVSNYFGGHLLGFGLCAIATYGDNATAPAMMNDIRTRWNNVVTPAFTSGAYAGGGIAESYNYGPTHAVRLFQYGNAVLTATGEDIYTSYGAKIAENLLYNLKPDRWKSTDTGDMAGDYTGIMKANLPTVLASFLPGTAGDEMAYYYSHLAPTPYTTATNEVQKADVFTRFMNKNPRTQTDYRNNHPLVFRSIGDEAIFIRSDWTDNAIWSSYAAGNIRYADHENNHAGHIAIQRGSDYLLVNAAQWKGADGIIGNPSVTASSSNWTNTLFFYDNGEYIYPGVGYAGGQVAMFPDINAVLKYETTSGYTYAKADHSNAYDIASYSRNPTTRSLRYFYRNFVKVGDKTFVVYDRIKALKDTYTKKLYWHLNKQGQPISIDSKTTSSTVGSSKLFIKSVYPSTSTVTFAQDTNANGETITPRVEIADSVTSTDFNPLTVLIADSKSATIPAITQVLSLEGKMVGTYINQLVNPTVVMFSAGNNGNDVTVINGDTISYNVPAPVSSSLQHILVHLPPNTDFTSLPETTANSLVTYTVKTGAFPTEGTVQRTSSQGVLRLGTTAKPPAPPKWK